MTVSRRSLLKWTGAVAGGSALVGTATTFIGMPAKADGLQGVDKTVMSSCNVNCGSRCPLRLQVKDGAIVRVLSESTGNDEIGTQQIRACVRGRSIRQRIYSADRLKTPMKRKEGTKRGAGEWEEISWEQAYDLLASELKRIINKYGNEAVYLNYATGTLGGTIACSWPPNQSPFARLMNCMGGYLNHYNTYSSAQITSATPFTYGKNLSNNSNDDAKNSKLVVMFGYNPQEVRMSGGGEMYVTTKTRKDHNMRTIVIDPRYSDTALAVGDEWIPIRPGADAALVAGLAHVLITENLVDKPFLDKYVIGYDEQHMPAGVPAGNSYHSYIMGKGPDGIAKTPEWAAQITGIPAQRIVQLGREIGSAKPCRIAQGLGPQRHANGENTVRSVHALVCMVGQVGIPGGGNGGHPGNFSLKMANPWIIENPIDTAISVFMWTDAIDHGPEMTKINAGLKGSKDKLDVGIKFIWNYGGNTLINQHSDHNRTIALLEDDTLCEFICVIDNVMTSSGRYADLLLPDVSSAEQKDIIKGGQAGTLGYTIIAEKAIEPLHNSKTTFEMCSEIAKRMSGDKWGDVLQKFTEGRTQDEWVQHCYDSSKADVPNLPPFADTVTTGIWKEQGPSLIQSKDFIADPVANKLETPSGKIEIFSKLLWDISKTWELPEGDRVTALPEYTPTWEGPEEAKTNEKYPLQMIGHHYKARTHSSYGNTPWMMEAHNQVIWLNPLDAEARGIANDDLVDVYNDRGRVRIPARVTPRIAPGVTSLPQGAWYTPDKQGVDLGGSVNVLTSWRPSPLAKGNPQHTNLVQVEKSKV